MIIRTLPGPLFMFVVESKKYQRENRAIVSFPSCLAYICIVVANYFIL